MRNSVLEYARSVAVSRSPWCDVYLNCYPLPIAKPSIDEWRSRILHSANHRLRRLATDSPNWDPVSLQDSLKDGYLGLVVRLDVDATGTIHLFGIMEPPGGETYQVENGTKITYRYSRDESLASGIFEFVSPLIRTEIRADTWDKKAEAKLFLKAKLLSQWYAKRLRGMRVYTTRSLGSGWMPRDDFLREMRQASTQLRKKGFRVTQEVVATRLGMDRGTLIDYLRRYDIDWNREKHC